MTTHSLVFPKLRKCARLSIAHTEAFVAAAGFEDRAFAAIKLFSKTIGGKATILEYKAWDTKNKLIELKDALAERGIHVRNEDILEYDRFNPEVYAEQLASWFDRNGIRRVVLDISAMSKMAILLCLDVCREKNLKVTVFYAEARRYSPSREAYERALKDKRFYRPSIQVYTGVGAVVRVARLSSVAMQGEPAAAIMFMSFNELLTQSLLSSVYPSRLFLINGRPPEHKWREEATAWIHEKLRKEWPDRDNELQTRKSGRVRLPRRFTSTLKYAETTAVLLKLYWRLAENYRIILGPTGSKMQTVGCFLAKALHPDIHIEYPTPKGFLPLYSEGVGASWCINFGSLGDCIHLLRSEERKIHLSVYGEVDAMEAPSAVE